MKLIPWLKVINPYTNLDPAEIHMVTSNWPIMGQVAGNRQPITAEVVDPTPNHPIKEPVFYWDHGGCQPFFHLKIQFRAGLVEPSFDTKIKSTCMYIHYTYFMMPSIWHGTVSSTVSWYFKSVTLCFIISLLMFLWCWLIPSINIAAPDVAKTISLTSMLSRNNILVFLPFLLLHKNILSTSRCSRATCQ